jgi:hypothetical protein
MFEYYLPEGTEGPVVIEVVDASGTVVNSFESAAGTAQAPMAEPGVQPDDPRAMMMAGRGGSRGRRGGARRPTLEAGHNRFVWDVRDGEGITMPPGGYGVRLTVAGQTHSQPFSVRIDPRIAADGVTVADLVEQYEHNSRVAALVDDVGALVQRVQRAREELRDATGADARRRVAVDEIAGRLLDEEVRYGKPGLRTQITYLRGITMRADQKIGRDVIERYQVLRRQLDAIVAEVDRILGG